MSVPSTSPARRAAAAGWPWAIPAALVAAWLVHVLRHYEIRAFSDPLNWLHFARHFGTEIHASKFALGFPLFLRPALEILGPFRVFLVNVPVLLAVYLLAAVLAVQAFAPDERAPRWQIVAVTLALFFGFDPWLVVQMANPFRDPLSFLFSLAAMNLLVRHAATGGARPARALAGGLLLGLACSVRETSVLLLAPIALYAFWSWRADSRIRFGRDLLLFAGGMFVGLAPLMVQGFIRTGQALVPPQSAVDNQLVPGAHFTWTILRRTVRHAWPYFLEKAGPGLVLLAGCAGGGLWRRNRVVAGLLLPAAAIHAAFYAFYWTFVPRYYYSVAVFAIPALAWSLLAAVRGLAARAPGRFRTAVPATAAAAIALAAAAHLLAMRPATPRFQIPQARLLKADLERLVPADSLVFCRRNLCEMVRWFTHARAFPATSLIPTDVPAEAALRQALLPYQSETRPVFALEMHTGPDWEVDAALLNRIGDLELVASLPTDRYHLGERTGARELRLFRVRSWTPLAPVLPETAQARDGFARLDFSLGAVPDAMRALSGAAEPPTLGRNTPRIRGSATVALPGPVSAGESAFAEIRLRCPERAGGVLEVAATLGGTSRSFPLPKDRAWHAFVVSTAGPLDSPSLELRAAAPFDLHRVDWSIPAPTVRLKVDLGANGDFALLREGWHAREKTAGGDARWTEPAATLAWRCADPGAPGRITLRHFARNRPADAAPPRLLLNGAPLAAAPLPDPEPGCATLAADIPAGRLQADNLIRIESEGWRPGGNDPRTLGVFADWISFETTAP